MNDAFVCFPITKPWQATITCSHKVFWLGCESLQEIVFSAVQTKAFRVCLSWPVLQVAAYLRPSFLCSFHWWEASFHQHKQWQSRVPGLPGHICVVGSGIGMSRCQFWYLAFCLSSESPNDKGVAAEEAGTGSYSSGSDWQTMSAETTSAQECGLKRGVQSLLHAPRTTRCGGVKGAVASWQHKVSEGPVGHVRYQGKKLVASCASA